MTWQIDIEVSAEISRMVSAGCPVVAIETWEEERLRQVLNTVAESVHCELWSWSLTRGFESGAGASLGLTDPISAMEFFRDEGAGAICLAHDLPVLLSDNPRLQRLIRDVYDERANDAGVLVMVSPSLPISVDLAKELNVYRMPLPSTQEILSYITWLNEQSAAESRFGDQWLESCAHQMVGLTSNEARLLFSQLVSGKTEDPIQAKNIITDHRTRALHVDTGLEVVNTALGFDAIGGLKNLKQWLESRQRLFGVDARKAGIPAPSGILMMGVSGCGKSLAAKVVAAAWGLPLIRLDMNKIMSGAWGSPEFAWDRALRTLSSIKPAVLWMDEIENSFGYINGHSTGGNLTIFSSFLTWMQEKAEGIFVVATANNIDLLPAEMLRKGRFDELFFLDLPKQDARSEILKIHIARQGGDTGAFDIEQLSSLVEGWTAAEIEQLINSAKLNAFYADRSFSQEDVKNISFGMIPLSKTMSEQINELRRWARSRAVSAD